MFLNVYLSVLRNNRESVLSLNTLKLFFYFININDYIVF